MNSSDIPPGDTAAQQDRAGENPCGPRNEYERFIYEQVREALDADEWIEYETVEELMEDLTTKACSRKR